MDEMPWYHLVDYGNLITHTTERIRRMVTANGLMFGEDEPPQYQPGVKGPYFVAGFGSPCSQGDWIVDGDVIRADGDGGWEHETCTGDEPMGGWQEIFSEPTMTARGRSHDFTISNRRVMAQRQEAREARGQYFGFADAMETDGIDQATVTFTPEGLAVFPEKLVPAEVPAEPSEHDQYERIATALSEHPYWTPEPRDYEPEPEVVRSGMYTAEEWAALNAHAYPDQLIRIRDNGTEWVYPASQWRAILAHYEAANGINSQFATPDALGDYLNRNSRPE
jgi:hypothetical protein